MIVFFLIAATLLLAWSNGANDNFKGVATLHGSGILSYRRALIWAALATLAGGLVSVLLADALVKTFSGDAILRGGALEPAMLAAMMAAAGATVLVASVVGMPTSTTHALMGALLGVALSVDPGSIRIDRVGVLFLGPMLLSPIIAIVAAALLSLIVRRAKHSARARMTGNSAPCLCVEAAEAQPVLGPARLDPSGAAVLMHARGAPALTVRIATTAACQVHRDRRLLRLDGQVLANIAHGLSGGAVCFARALNDTPKIAAVLLTTGGLVGLGHTGLGQAGTLLGITLIVVAGGVVQGRRVARTMSRRITSLGTGSGLSANIVTAALVLWASRLGLPVSTTHVSCSSIFGVGLAQKSANRSTITRILATWLTTLPFAALLGAGFYALVRWLSTGV